MGKYTPPLTGDTPKRVGIWIRVSTEDQARGESPQHHEKRARMLAEAKGWKVVTVYDLSGVSGRTVLDHPECKRMLGDVSRQAITGLVFSKLARLARNTRELLEFSDYFSKHDADLISIGESIDTSTPSGRLFYTIIAAMAQWERDEISERVQASVPIRARLGKSTGGKPALGYHRKGGKVVPHPDEAPVRRLVYELFVEHRRRKKVARILNERGFRTRSGSKFSDSTVLRLLTDPTAIGEHRVNYTRSESGQRVVLKPRSEWVFQPTEPIISRELWDSCQRILAEQHRTKPAARTAVHLFSGYAYCGCGQKMYPRVREGKYICWGCGSRIPADDLEAVFRSQLQSFFLSEDSLRDFLNGETNALAAKEEEVAVLEQQTRKAQAEVQQLLTTLTGAISPADIELLVGPRVRRLRELEEAWPNAQAGLDILKINQLTNQCVVDGARDLYSHWGELTDKEKRSIVEAIVESIIVRPETVEINLHYVPSETAPLQRNEKFPEKTLETDVKKATKPTVHTANSR